MTGGSRERGGLYYRWMLANAWSEAVGLGTTLVGGLAAAPWLDRAGQSGLILGAVTAVVLGTLLEGVVVGVAQERVLRAEMPDLRPGAWTTATALGAGTAWLIGMIPSTVFGMAGQTGGPASSEPSPAMQYALAMGLGLITGPILGSAQFLVLRRFTRGAGRWLGANAVAWAVGMPAIFWGMDQVPWSRGGGAVAAIVYAVCGAVGGIVGAIHGRTLLRLVATSSAPAA